MIILDTLLIGGIRFVLGKIAAAVEAEMTDDTALREELLALQMRRELGEVDETELRAGEAALLAAIREVRARRRAAPEESPAPGEMKVTGIEATVWDDADESSR
jgi:hypothetical protein